MFKSTKIFIACFLGAGVGALAALQLNPWFWWIGMLVGGTVGYLSYEFDQVVATAKTVYRELSRIQPAPIDWQEIARSIVLFFPRFCFRFCLAHIASSAVTFPLWLLLSAFFLPLPRGGPAGSTLGAIAITGIFTLVIISIAAADLALTERWSDEQARKAARKENIVSMSARLLRHLRANLVGWLKFVFEFCKRVFLAIHSEERLLCFCDAAIGSAIGYFLGNALLGALTGGLLGVLNYELVSKRWLKLIPEPFQPS